MGTKWGIYVDPQDKEEIPFFVVVEKGEIRPPTKEEAERGCRILNEDGENLVRLWCRNPVCKEANKGWIERATKDAAKTLYTCALCGKPMVR